jgi:hypothetical protein
MAGLGITLLNFGIQMRGGLDIMLNTNNNGTYTSNPSDNPDSAIYTYNPSIGEVTQITKPPPPPSVGESGYIGAPVSSTPANGYGYGANGDLREMDWLQISLETHWVSMVLMMAGWMVLVKALADYALAKRMESIIKARPESEDLEDRGELDDEEEEEEEEEEEGMEELYGRLGGDGRESGRGGSRIVGYISSEDDV